MSNIKNAELFFIEVLKCFKMKTFKEASTMDMLLVSHPEWYNYLLETKEFGILKDIDGMDYFVSTTSKSGIAFKGEIKKKEEQQIQKLVNYYESFYNLDINSQGKILQNIFPQSNNKEADT